MTDWRLKRINFLVTSDELEKIAFTQRNILENMHMKSKIFKITISDLQHVSELWLCQSLLLSFFLNEPLAFIFLRIILCFRYIYFCCCLGCAVLKY